MAINEVRTLPLTPSKGGSKSEFFIFVNKIELQLSKVCYKFSLCEIYSSKVGLNPRQLIVIYLMA